MLYGFVSFLSPLAHPVGFLWLLLLLGAAFLLKRKQWLAGLMLLAIAALMSLMGSRLPTHLLTTLERPYYPRGSISNAPTADAVVLLGGSFEFSRYEPTGFNLNAAADRVLVALELMRLQKAKALVLGGREIKYMDADPTKRRNESYALEKWLKSWSLPGAPVIVLEGSGNTHDEAVKTAALAKEKGWKSVIVVTTGTHMRRAEAVFRTTGLEVTPVACDFQRLGTPNDGWEFNPIPGTGGFQHLNSYVHEHVAWLVYRWHGWISAEAASNSPVPATPVGK